MCHLESCVSKLCVQKHVIAKESDKFICNCTLQQREQSFSFFFYLSVLCYTAGQTLFLHSRLADTGERICTTNILAANATRL